jgi:hypothetical protein
MQPNPTSKKTILQFKVCPNYLKNNTTVPDPVRIFITDPESIFITGILGESGRRMIADGAPFIFTKALAQKLIDNNVATLAPDQSNLD